MRKIWILTALVSFAIISSCKKDQGTAETYEDNYRFFIKGKASGLPFEFYAGQEDYYMKTSYNFLDSVVEMVGILAPQGTVRKNAFEIKIRSQQSVASVQQFDVNQNLVTGSIAMRDATGFRRETDKFILTLNCDTTGAYIGLPQWKLPDGAIRTGFEITEEVSLQDYQKFAVSMTTTGSFNCQSEIMHVINLEDDCDATFDMIPNGFDVILSQPKNVVGAMDYVKWYHNDNPIVLASSRALTLSPGDTHTIKCVVYFTDGCTKTIERTIAPNLNIVCSSDFNVKKQREAIYDPMQLATVEITYYDDAGKAYSSHYNDVYGEFEIVSITPFSENEDGTPTHRIFFETEAILKSSDGSTIDLRDTYGSFAVAHP